MSAPYLPIEELLRRAQQAQDATRVSPRPDGPAYGAPALAQQFEQFPRTRPDSVALAHLIGAQNDSVRKEFDPFNLPISLPRRAIMNMDSLDAVRQASGHDRLDPRALATLSSLFGGHR